MNFKAIPTMYDGIQFRSRLEAKWYAFFDLLAWNPQYEPFDLDHWIPDIVIPATHPSWGHPSLLVEVKPFDQFPVWGHGAAPVAAVQGQIDHAAPGSPVMLVGLRPFMATGSHSPFLGIGRAPMGLGPMDEDSQVEPDWHRPRWSRVSFMGFPMFPYGGDIVLPAGRPHAGLPSQCPYTQGPEWAPVERLWAEAGNLVQYKSPRQ